MPTYKAPLDDVRFLLNEVLHVEELSRLPGYEEATPDLLMSVLEEGGRLCEEVLQPLNQTGDAEGCRIEDGQVHIRTSPARRIVYRPAGRHCMARGDLNGALTEASFPLEPDDIYFRLEVEDNAGLRAFTNAYFFDELNA